MADVAGVFPGDSEMARRMRAFDWSRTPLGAPETWSRNLRTSVRIVLTSRQPMFVWWGEQLINLYNDGYAEFLHARHPWALGQPAAAVWPEIWEQVGPRVEFARQQDSGTYDEALPFVLHRKGHPEETYVTFSYNPIPDDDGGFGGILCPITEETQRVVGERQLALLQELAARTADARTPSDACALAAQALTTNRDDLPFALIYLLDGDAHAATLAGCCGVAAGEPVAPERIAADRRSVWSIADVLESKRARVVSDLSAIADLLPMVRGAFRPTQAVIIPMLAAESHSHVCGMLIVGLNPLRRYDNSYEGFLELVAGSISAAVTNAQAYDNERRRAERRVAEQTAALRESEERFRVIADTAPVLIWMSGVDKLCTYVNQRWLDFTGQPLDATLGRRWTEGIHPEDIERSWDTYAKAFDRREPFEVEFRLRHHDGEYRWVVGAGVPRHEADGSFAGYIGSTIDITERKLAEEALSTINQRLIEAQEEERARLARELHDDVNQRLGLLSWRLGTLAQDFAAPGAELRQKIENTREEIASLATDIQALSHRLHSPRLEYLGLTAAAAELCGEVSEQQGRDVSFHAENIPSGLPQRISLCLFRVLQEALQNAIKHSGARCVGVSLQGGAGWIELIVRDPGSGFNPEDAARGRGLGLTSMKERLKAVDGQLSVDTKPNAGTTIRARVPLLQG